MPELVSKVLSVEENSGDWADNFGMTTSFWDSMKKVTKTTIHSVSHRGFRDDPGVCPRLLTGIFEAVSKKDDEQTGMAPKALMARLKT